MKLVGPFRRIILFFFLAAGIAVCLHSRILAQENSVHVQKLSGSYRTVAMKPFGYFPVIVQREDGEIIAVLRGGAAHMGKKGNLKCIRSSDGGISWSEPASVVDSEWDDRNPAVGLGPRNLIVVAYHENQKYYDDSTYAADDPSKHAYARIVRSPDNGETWFNPGGDTRVDFGTLMYASPFGRILNEPDGTMLMPIYGGAGLLKPGADPAGKEAGSYLLRSDDYGFTWGQPTLIAGGMNETNLLFLPNEEYLAFMRSEEKGRIFVCRSNDRGFTWSEPIPVTDASEHPPDPVLLGGGAILLIFGRRHQPYGIEGILSFDNGKTWDTEHRIIITDDLTTWDIGYPSSVRTADGTIITMYYACDAPPDPYKGWTRSRAEVVRYKENEILNAYRKITGHE